MSFNTEFYDSIDAPERILDTIPDKSKIFLHRMESLDITGSLIGIVDGEYTLATTLFTITGAAFTPDDLIGGFIAVKVTSLIGVLIPIIDNDADTITIDPADTLSERDVASDLVDATTYQIRVFSDQRCIGETIDAEINPNAEYKDFDTGFPAATEQEFLTSYKPEFLFLLRTAGQSIRKILFKSKDINPSSTVFKHFATGHEPRPDNYFLIITVGPKNAGLKETRAVFLFTKIKPNGNCPTDAPLDSFIEYPIMVKPFKDTLYPVEESLFRHMEKI